MSLNAILVDVLKGNVSSGELDRMLSEQSITAQEYNDALMLIFSYQFYGCISDIATGAEIGNVYQNATEDLSALNGILEEFYKIENCPSFLYHYGILEKEDYSLLFQIYTEIFGLQTGDEDGRCEWIKNQFEDYAKELLIECRDCKTEDDFLSMICEKEGVNNT